MVWVCIALSIPLVLLLLLQFLRVHFSIDLQTPATLRGSMGISFFWFHREVAVDAARAFSSRHDGGGEDDKDEADEGTAVRAGNASATSGTEGGASGLRPDTDFPGQKGALRVPDSWRTYFSRLAARFRKAAVKSVLDFHVWRLLLRFALKSGRRVLALLHPRLKSIHLGMEDVYDLGRIAALWSVLSATLPALSGPAEFGFNEKSFNLQATVAGGFNGLHALLFGLLTLFSFPWLPLGARFAHCWRDPRLNRWQRRVLLP